jgi:hypothetical protein
MLERRARTNLGALVVALLAVAGPSASSLAAPAEPGSAKLEPVALIPFKNGSHQVFAQIHGRDYAFVATGVTDTNGELRVIDVTQPTKPKVVAKIPCGTYQGHLQLSADKKTLILGVDTPSLGACVPAGEMGFATVDISNPKKPRPIGYAPMARGSHTTATHPTKPFVYNGQGFPEAPGEMEIWSIANPAKPKLVNTFKTGEHSPHDLSFNADGTLAALASVSSLKLLDTTDPANPTIEFVTQCPGCQHTHEARFTPDGAHLVVNDEALSGPYPCPGAALHIYEVVELPSGSHALRLEGEYYPGEVGTDANSQVGFCTSHVFDISAEGTKIAASWHSDGIRYLDISQTTGATFGTMAPAGGVVELASYTPPNSDMFSAKFNRGPYIYAVDIQRGFEVLRITSGS